MLASNAMIMQALIQGGWSNDNKEEEEEEKDKDSDNEKSDHSLVNSILKGSEDSQLVQSALKSQNVSFENQPSASLTCILPRF